MTQSKNWMTLLSGVLFIVAALLIFINPALSLATLGFVMAFNILIDGAVSIGFYFSTPRASRKVWTLIAAILSIVIAVILLGNSMISQAAFASYALGFWLLVLGISRLMLGFQAGREGRGLLIASGVLTIIVGLAIIAHPLVYGAVAVWTLGVALFIYGIVRIVEFFRPAAAEV